MRSGVFGWLLCFGLITLLVASIATEAGAAAYQIDLCSRRTGKRIRATVLKSNSEFLDVLNEDGEHIILQANGYDQCSPGPDISGPRVIDPPVTPPQPQALDTLKITGSSTVGQGVLPYFISGYAKKIGGQMTELPSDDPLRRTYELRTPKAAPFLRIMIKSSGSNTALPDMIDKQADAGVSSRPYADEEIAKLLAIRGVGSRPDVEHVIALDGVQFFVNKDNPAAILKLCDVARLFGGQIKTWSELVPQAPGSVDLHTGDSRSGTFEIVTENLLDPCREKISRAVTPHNSQAEIISSVSNSRGGIGYSAKALSSSTVKTLHLRDQCGIEAEPTPFNIKTEDYPLSRRLYLFTPRAVGNNARAFLDYVFSSDAAQSALNDSEATNQAIETGGEDTRLARGRALRENQDRMAGTFSSETAHAKRLSISYRFASDNAKLDTKAEQDILRLVTYLRGSRTASTILLAGFADSAGSKAGNQILSQGRAEAVKDAIAKLDPALAASITPRGYGSVLPVSCNDTELGKAKNRRVEVWLKAN